MKRFSEMDLSKATTRVLKEKGFEMTTQVQETIIPKLLGGKSLAVQSKTGSGKTLSYAIPVVEKLDDTKNTQALVLCPTRELATQVTGQFSFLLRYHGKGVTTLYGGQKIGIQLTALKKHPLIVVGTPGRILDHLNRRTLSLKSVRMFVLDEADEMLNMGFLEDVKKILSYVSSTHQSVLLSATMPKEVVNLGRHLQKDMEFFKLSSDEVVPNSAKQYYFKVDENKKAALVLSLLSKANLKNTMVFCNTKKKVEEVTLLLKKNGVNAESMHGDLRQQSRERIMKRFRNGKTKVLVATDVAARGIDLTVEAVVNYDLPCAKLYVHRIGRTARMGRKGYAYVFITPRQRKELFALKKYIRSDIKMIKIPS